MRIRAVVLLATLAQASAWAQPATTQAQGSSPTKRRSPSAKPEHKKAPALAQIVSPGGAEIIRNGDQTKLIAQAGDLLFNGDTLLTQKQAAQFVYCPPQTAKVQRTLGPNGSAIFAAAGVRAITGTLSPAQPASFCELPVVDINPETTAKGTVEGAAPTRTAVDASRLSAEDRQTLAR